MKDLEDRIVEFKAEESSIAKNMRDILAQIVKIDGSKPVLATVDSSNPEEEFKEGIISADSALTFLMKENRVMSLDLVSQRLIEIEQLQETYLAKLVPVTNRSLLVIGGQSTKQRSIQSTQIKNQVVELYWNDVTEQWR